MSKKRVSVLPVFSAEKRAFRVDLQTLVDIRADLFDYNPDNELTLSDVESVVLAMRDKGFAALSSDGPEPEQADAGEDGAKVRREYWIGAGVVTGLYVRVKPDPADPDAVHVREVLPGDPDPDAVQRLVDAVEKLNHTAIDNYGIRVNRSDWDAMIQALAALGVE